MHYDIFQNIQSLRRRSTDSQQRLLRLTGFARPIIKGEADLFPFLAMILSFLIVSGWGGILLATGNTEGGGPICTLAGALLTAAGM